MSAMSIEDQFKAAVKVIRSLPKNGTFQPSDELKLKFYAYFKQATDGPNDTRKPAFYDIVNRYKWDVWKKLGDMDKTTAMKLYVDELKKVIETCSMNEEVGDFLDILGPFYEFLPEKENDSKQSKLANGKCLGEMNNNNNNNNSYHEETAADIVSSFFNAYDSEGDNYYDTVEATGTDSAQTEVTSSTRDHRPRNANVKVFSTSYSCQTTPQRRPQQQQQQQSSPPAKVSSSGQGVLHPQQQQQQQQQVLSFNEQLCLTILQLQTNVEQLHRRVAQVESDASGNTRQGRNKSSGTSASWPPFQELSYSTTACVIAWPLVAFFVLNYLRQPRK